MARVLSQMNSNQNIPSYFLNIDFHIKSIFFWDVTSCSTADVDRRFGRMFLLLQGRGFNKITYKQQEK
jgi:hypothetical protein